MKSFVDKLVDLAKELPGFGLVFLIITVAYTYLKKSPEELTATETFVAALICWLIYHASSLLDYVYNVAYGPNSKLAFFWKSEPLHEARNRAAVKLFGPIDERVVDYRSALELRYVGDDEPLKSLYFFCSTAAKPTDAWTSKIAPKINVSKAARTVFVFALIAVLMVKIKPLREVSGLPMLTERLGLFSNVWLLLAIAFAAFVIYVVLRVLHNIQLFDYVASEVMHVPKENNQRAAVIFEVTLPQQAGPIP